MIKHKKVGKLLVFCRYKGVVQQVLPDRVRITYRTDDRVVEHTCACDQFLNVPEEGDRIAVSVVIRMEEG